MPGIGTTVVTNDNIVLIGKEIDDFPFGSSPHCRPTTHVHDELTPRGIVVLGKEINENTKKARDPRRSRAAKVLCKHAHLANSSGV